MSTPENTNQRVFSINLVGEETGTLYTGDFIAIRFLASRQHFLQDQLYRRYLGGDALTASPEAQERARVLADANAYCVKFPEWWTKADGGLDIPDNNCIITVWNELNKIYAEVADERAKKVKDSAAKLKEIAEKAEKAAGSETK